MLINSTKANNANLWYRSVHIWGFAKHLYCIVFVPAFISLSLSLSIYSIYNFLIGHPDFDAISFWKYNGQDY